MELHNINYEIQDGIAYICFMCSDKYNIFTLDVEEELKQVWDDLTYQEDVRGVLFTGKPTAFLTGSDLRSLNVGDTAWMLETTIRQQNLFNRIQNFQGPTIAAIDGYATGAGLELALACDFRFASPQAVFAFPEVTLGMIPCLGGTQRLSRLVGIENAKLMIYSGEKVSADKAEHIRLISRIVEAENLEESARSLLHSILKNAPIAISNSKLCINLGSEMSLEQGLALERSTWLSLCTTEDAAEGIDAFLNKRKPIFKGR